MDSASMGVYRGRQDTGELILLVRNGGGGACINP